MSLSIFVALGIAIQPRHFKAPVSLQKCPLRILKNGCWNLCHCNIYRYIAAILQQYTLYDIMKTDKKEVNEDEREYYRTGANKTGLSKKIY